LKIFPTWPVDNPAKHFGHFPPTGKAIQQPSLSIKNLESFTMKKKEVIFSNIAEGTHQGNITYIAGEVIDAPNRLVALADGKITVADGGVLPIGSVTDEAEDAGDFVNVHLLGGNGTVIFVASSAIEQGSLLYGVNGGKVSSSPTGSGDFFCVGIALNAALADGDLVETLTTFPLKTAFDSSLFANSEQAELDV
jgi:hypothetical protein